MRQPDAKLQKARERSNHLPADPNDPEPTKFVNDRFFEHRSTEARMERKFQGCGCGVKGDTYDLVSKVFTSFIQSYWAAKLRNVAQRSDQRRERKMKRQDETKNCSFASTLLNRPKVSIHYRLFLLILYLSDLTILHLPDCAAPLQRAFLHY